MEPTYLTFYLNKVVSLAANKLIHNIYKCKKLPFTAYQFLQMDATEIKETLIGMVKTDQSILFLIKELILTRKIFRIILHSWIKPFPNLKTSLNFYNYQTKSFRKDMRCLWKDHQFRIWKRYCRWEGARRETFQPWQNQYKPKIHDNSKSVSHFEGLTLVIRNQLPHLPHIRCMHIPCSSLSQQISTTFVSV